MLSVMLNNLIKILGGTDGTQIGNSGDKLRTDGSGVTQPISALFQGPVSPGTVATKSNLMGGQYNSVLPTLTDTQQAAIQLDSRGRLVTTTAALEGTSSSFYKQDSVNSGVTLYTIFTASQKLAINSFYAGGTGIGKQSISLYNSAATQFISFGDFESSGDVTNWVYSTNAGTAALAFSTAQHNTGSGAMSLVFTTSDSNHYNGAKQTFSPAQDFSVWRYISAQFYNTVSTGAAYTRNISIILTDSNGATQTYLVNGLSTASPFNASGWVPILSEILNPTSITGVSFDSTSVISIELRMFDSVSKTGTVYWDTVKLSSSILPLCPIYHTGNSSFQLQLGTPIVLNISDQILLSQLNNDTLRKEFYALISGDVV